MTRLVSPPTEAELAYAAGLIDGEGCIGVYKNSHNGNFQLRITVEMVEREGLDLLAKIFGGRWYSKNKAAPRRPTHVWMTFNSEAERAIRMLIDHLRVKAPQANAVLKADWHSFAKRKMCPEQQLVRESVASEVKQYNMRGVV
jgi:hypothetical protein